MNKRTCSLLAAGLAVAAAVAHGAEPLNIGDRRELFLDDLLVERLEGDIARRFHEPVAREIVMTFDKSWEGNSVGYITVFQDGDLYRMYYRAAGYNLEGNRWNSTGGRGQAYAESKDGTHWTRPELGLVEFEGSKANNLLGRVGHNGVFFRDANPATPPEARYKAITMGSDHREDFIGGGHNVTAWQSSDGIRWEMMQREGIYDKSHRGLGAVPPNEVLTWLDSQNTAYWCPTEERYVMYYRIYTYDGEPQSADWTQPADYFQKRVRHIEKAVSDDFLNWERVGVIDAGPDIPALDNQFYTNVIKPYHRAPHIRIGLPLMYRDRAWSPAMEQLPDLEKRRLFQQVTRRSGSLGDVQLMWSRDGFSFEVLPYTFLPPGPERPDTWAYGDNSLSWHIVETESFLSGAAPELSLYAIERGCRLGQDTPRGLRRYTLRLDGFASLRATRQGGELITPPVIFDGSALSMNFATSASGSVRVELQDADGSSIPGFTLADSIELYGDTVARNAMWKDDPDLGALAGQPVRLRFVMRDADLYSIKFESVTKSVNKEKTS